MPAFAASAALRRSLHAFFPSEDHLTLPRLRLSPASTSLGWPVALALGSVVPAVIAWSPSADALPLIDLSASVRGLYGSATSDAEFSGYGAGIGLRAGITLPLSLYLGAGYDYFAGQDLEAEDLDIVVSTHQLMGNVGYDLGLGPLTLRPVVGLGLSTSSLETTSGLTLGGPTTIESSDSNFLIAPGAELIIGLGLLSVGGEVRYNKVFADGDADAIVVGAGLGLSF